MTISPTSKQYPMFSGETFVPELDGHRLNTQLNRVYDLMTNHEWWTLELLVWNLKKWFCIVATEASVSARIRDLRKPKFGGHIIERKRVKGGLFVYRLLL